MMKRSNWLQAGGRGIALGAAGLMTILSATAAETAAVKASPEKSAEKGEKKSLWMNDFRAAKELAAKEKKPLLVSFSGSDWNSPIGQRNIL